MANARKGGQASSPVPRLLVLRGGLFSSTPRFAAKNGLKYKKPDMGRSLRTLSLADYYRDSGRKLLYVTRFHREIYEV